MNILYLTTVLPSQPKTGGEIASRCFINALESDGNEVTVVGYQRHGDANTKKSNEISIGYRHIETSKSRLHPILWMGCALIKNLPYSSAKYYTANYKNQVNQLLENQSFDILIIEHAQLGWLLPSLEKKFTNIIFVAHNIEHEIYQSHLDSPRNNLTKPVYRREASRIKSIEDYLANNTHQVWTLTKHDSTYFQHINSHTLVFDVPSGLPVTLASSTIKTCDIGIIGSWTWKPNQEGLRWFFQSVYPHLPLNLSIRVAGKGAEWLDGMYPNVEYFGFVPDVTTFLHQARTIAIPSTSGGGIQIKTLDAIASGSLIVATPTALRGICDYPSGITVAKEADDFAYSLVNAIAFSHNGKETLAKLQQEQFIWSQNRHKQFISNVSNAILILKNREE